MKKYWKNVSYLLTICCLMAGFTFADAAKTSTDNFTVRFRENTLVVTAAQMEEARIYSLDGKLLQKERGNYVEFELEQGRSSRLYAKVGNTMERRRIELR